MTLPVVESVTVTGGAGRSGSTMTVNFPATVDAGDTLACYLSQDYPTGDGGWSGVSWPSDWLPVYEDDDQGSGFAYGACAVLKADGSEDGGTFTVGVANRPCTAIVVRISGAVDPTTLLPYFALHYSYGVPNINQYPPTLQSPTVPRLNDYAVVTVCHYNTDDGPMNAYPAGYTTGTTTATDGAGTRLSYGYKTATLQSEDPGRFRLFGLSRDFVVVTMFFAPAVDSTTTNDERVTQAALQVLYEIGAEARVTQAAAQVLYEVDATLRVTHLAIQALVPAIPCVRRRCQVWKITRRDGTEYHYTTHDEQVAFHGDTYQPCNSLRASAAEAGTLNAVGGGDIQIAGLIASDEITERDLANGLFDGAQVEVWEIPWDDSTLASDSPKRLLKGAIGETTQGPTSYQAEVFTRSAKLAQNPLLDTFTPACRFKPGDGRCPIDVAALTTTGTVLDTVTRIARDRRAHRQFYTSAPGAYGSSSSSSGEPAVPWDYGLLTWLTGDNQGIEAEIKSIDSDSLLTLWDSMPNEIQVGDTFSVKPGCARTKDAHVTTWGFDIESFGGFPDIPGVDSIIRGPRR